MYLQSLSHDLRTPLNGIICIGENLKEERKDDNLIQGTIKIIKSQCLYQLLMIEMIHELSKM